MFLYNTSAIATHSVSPDTVTTTYSYYLLQPPQSPIPDTYDYISPTPSPSPTYTHAALTSPTTTTSKHHHPTITMPGRPHTRPSPSGGSSPRSPGAHAHFPTIPHSISRLPHDDEKLVLRAFARHTTTCSTCNIPHGLLCTRGYARACDIEDYISVHRGRAYSVVDHKRERKRVQIEIPGDVRGEVEGLMEVM